MQRNHCLKSGHLHFNKEFPLSYNQQSLWFLNFLAPESAAYNLFFPVRILSPLDVQSLKCAFQQLILRHPSLRTTYSAPDGKPVQYVHDNAEIFFKEIDASSWSKDELNGRLVEDSHRPFDLQNGPILRVSLYKCSTQEQILLLNFHNIAVDLSSLLILLDEFRLLYHPTNENQRSTTQHSYSEFVRWQSDMLAGTEGERLWAYWQKKLCGKLPVLNLPLDKPRLPVQTYNGDFNTFRINEILTQKIKELGHNSGATLYMTLLAAFQVLLYRYTSQQDILVGSLTSGRSRPEFSEIIGHFANPVVIRSDLSGNPSFNSFLSQVRQTVSEALAHQDYPFQLLVEKLHPERDPSRSPLFQVMYVLEKPHRVEDSAPFLTKEANARMKLGDMGLESFPLEEGIAKFDLTLMIAETSGYLSASFEYNSDIFDPLTIRRMAGHFETLLESIAANPYQEISQLHILTKAEEHQLLIEWNNPQPENLLSFIKLIEAKVIEKPEHTAVVFEDNKITFRELNERANQIAHFLKDRYNIQLEDRVGVLLDRSEWMVIAILGILKAGCAYVPLDPSYPKERARYIIDDSECKVILTEEKYFEFFRPVDGDLKKKVNIREIRHPNTDNLCLSISSDSMSYIIYTSGLADRPQGIIQTHRCLDNLIHWQLKEIPVHKEGNQEEQRILQYAAPCSDVLLQETLYSLASGSELYVIPSDLRYNMPDLAAFLWNKKIDVIFMPFSALNLLFREGIGENLFLRHIITSGEILQIFPELEEYLNAHPSVNLHNQYGLIETHVVTAYTISASKGNIVEYPPIGNPISNTRILILDERLHLVPAGVTGEIYIESTNMARGYLNRDGLTRDKFIPHPFRETGRVFRTGDLGRWLADGNIEFQSRNDDHVKIRGYRVELREIENRLMQYEGVKEAVVIAKNSGKGFKELVAYVAGKEDPDQSQSLNMTALRRYLNTVIPAYMIPSNIFQVEKFSYTPTGKIDKRALLNPFKIVIIQEVEPVITHDEIELKLISIWQDVLNLKSIGGRDNFFDLGGHSLKGMQIISRIREVFQIEIPVRELFIHPTIEQLSDIIRKKRDTSYLSDISSDIQLNEYPVFDANEDIVPASDEEYIILKKLLDESEKL